MMTGRVGGGLNPCRLAHRPFQGIYAMNEFARVGDACRDPRR